jgi:hypothetical protein
MLTNRVRSLDTPPGTDLGGTSDPYASVALGEITRKTSTAFRTCDPAWGERFEFIAAKALEDDEVIVTLYDEDLVGAHDFLGQITIPVRAVDEARRGGSGAFYLTLVPIRPRWRGECHFLRTFPVVSLRPGSLAFNTRPRRLSTPLLTPFN